MKKFFAEIFGHRVSAFLETQEHWSLLLLLFVSFFSFHGTGHLLLKTLIPSRLCNSNQSNLYTACPCLRPTWANNNIRNYSYVVSNTYIYRLRSICLDEGWLSHWLVSFLDLIHSWSVGFLINNGLNCLLVDDGLHSFLVNHWGNCLLVNNGHRLNCLLYLVYGWLNLLLHGHSIHRSHIWRCWIVRCWIVRWRIIIIQTRIIRCRWVRRRRRFRRDRRQWYALNNFLWDYFFLNFISFLRHLSIWVIFDTHRWNYAASNSANHLLSNPSGMCFCSTIAHLAAHITAQCGGSSNSLPSSCASIQASTGSTWKLVTDEYKVKWSV